MSYVPLDESTLYARAQKRVEERRGFYAHLLAYVLVNTFLIAIWWMTSPDSFFWPVFPILGWGIGLAFNAWAVYVPGPTEQQIRAEMDRMRRETAG